MSIKASAYAHPNIAFIKYWGNRNDVLRLPVNGSLSMNLHGLHTHTHVEWSNTLSHDSLTINGVEQMGRALERVIEHLDVLRERYQLQGYAAVQSENNFPIGAGVASSASSFAALTLAAAAHLDLSERELTTLARLGSGSASRSVPTGFVEWYAAETHEESFAESFAAPDHWNLTDVVAIISTTHKAVGSTEGHQSAATSDLQMARVARVSERIAICKSAILQRDFAAFAEVVELDSNLMHAVMMTSRPALFYWLPASLAVMHLVGEWRREGLNVCYTLDAGPNVHCLCTSDHASEIANRLRSLDGVLDVRTAGVGGGAYLDN